MLEDPTTKTPGLSLIVPQSEWTRSKGWYGEASYSESVIRAGVTRRMALFRLSKSEVEDLCLGRKTLVEVPSLALQRIPETRSMPSTRIPRSPLDSETQCPAPNRKEKSSYPSDTRESIEPIDIKTECTCSVTRLNSM